jgi:hypothetical protein
MKTEKDMDELAWFSSGLPHAKAAADSHLSTVGRIETIGYFYETDNLMLPADLIHLRVPRLDQTGLNMNADLPRIPDNKLTPTKPRDPARSPTRVIKTKSLVVVPKRVKKRPTDVVVQVVPTPQKKERKTPKPEHVTPRNPKPLKVIRRRGKEEEKVFETGPKLIPDAMLKGVKPKSLEEIDRREK